MANCLSTIHRQASGKSRSSLLARASISNWNQIYPDELMRVGVPLLSPMIDDCRLLQDLPKHHGDPFDRMLLCQAKRRGLGIISADKVIDSYQVKRVW
jgi:PIN domain nuclease of toxin-antitoxin system